VGARTVNVSWHRLIRKSMCVYEDLRETFEVRVPAAVCQLGWEHIDDFVDQKCFEREARLRDDRWALTGPDHFVEMSDAEWREYVRDHWSSLRQYELEDMEEEEEEE